MRPGPEAHDDALTQPIARRVIPRLPGSLDPSASPDDGTEVMSLDELMDLAAASPAREAPPVAPPPPPPPPPPVVSPAPVATPAPAVAAGPDLRERVVADARQAYLAAMHQGRDWLRTGDNGLIAATAAVVMLLLIVIAAV